MELKGWGRLKGLLMEKKLLNCSPESMPPLIFSAKVDESAYFPTSLPALSLTVFLHHCQLYGEEKSSLLFQYSLP